MDNVTKIKFQYFKPLEKGTEERRAGGSVGLPRGRSAGRGGGDRRSGGGGASSRGGACREARPSPAAGSDARTPGRRVRFGTRRARLGASRPVPAQSRPPPAPQAAGSRRSGAFLPHPQTPGPPRAGSGFPGNVLQLREHAGKAPARQ